MSNIDKSKKHRKKRNPNTPNTLIPNVLKRLPGIFDRLKNVQDSTGEDILPFGVITNLIKEQYGLSTMQAISEAKIVQALFYWGKNKQIYDFNVDIAEELIVSFESAESLPIEVFDNMPYDCVYMSVNDDKFQVFATKDIRVDTKKQKTKQISFYFPQSDKILYLPFSKNTIADCIVDDYNTTMDFFNDCNYIESIKKEYPGKTIDEIQEQVKNSYKKDYINTKRLLEERVALLLYLCSQNAEIVDTNGFPKNYYRNDVPNNNDDVKIVKEESKEKGIDNYTPKNPLKPKKVEKLKVGYRIGKTIHYNKTNHADSTLSKNQKQISNNSKPYTKKSAHIRRGHYHHYWAGSKKNGTQKLILKWTPPTFVNATNENEIIPTKHKIKM